ncbi:MAG: hypothetical protein Kow0040_25440 [Thermogutta sp.]
MTAVWKLLLDDSHPGLPDSAEYVRELRRYCTRSSTARETGQPTNDLPSFAISSPASVPAFGHADAGKTAGRTGIVGAGLMGCTIAALFLRSGHHVTLQDVQSEALQAAPDRIAQDSLAAGVAESDLEILLPRLRLSETIADFRDCDFVLECVVEDEAVKRDLLARLEAVLNREAVLASNTSSIALATLAAGLTRPDRFLGLHFLHPVRDRMLVEVVRAPATAPEVLDAARRRITGLGRLPLEVNDGPGFVVNRLLFPFLSEALQVLRQGLLPHQVDAAVERCGWVGGPCKIMDEIGIDTTFRVGRVLWQAFPDRVAPSPILVTLLKRKRLGRKCGSGFYGYAGTTAWTTPPQRDETCEDWIRAWWEIEAESRPPSEDIVRRVILGMMLEGFRLPADGVVDDLRSVDAAAVFGLGFPQRWGGPCRLAQAMGATTLFEDLAELATFSPFFAINERTERVIRRVVHREESDFD